jgi:hypothetical protein
VRKPGQITQNHVNDANTVNHEFTVFSSFT